MHFLLIRQRNYGGGSFSDNSYLELCFQSNTEASRDDETTHRDKVDVTGIVACSKGRMVQDRCDGSLFWKGKEWFCFYDGVRFQFF